MGERHKNTSGKKRIYLVLTIVWGIVIFIGLAILVKYSVSPGESSLSPSVFPSSSTLGVQFDKPVLLVFVHPPCPCTRATLYELERLMTRYQGRVNGYAVFYQPYSVDEEWARTGLWRKAESIRNVRPLIDNQGKEAKIFRTETSGQVVLYDTTKKLLFSGGITAARGHAGDNAGTIAITSLLRNRVATKSETPVFGCSIFND